MTGVIMILQTHLWTKPTEGKEQEDGEIIKWENSEDASAIELAVIIFSTEAVEQNIRNEETGKDEEEIDTPASEETDEREITEIVSDNDHQDGDASESVERREIFTCCGRCIHLAILNFDFVNSVASRSGGWMRRMDKTFVT